MNTNPIHTIAVSTAIFLIILLPSRCLSARFQSDKDEPPLADSSTSDSTNGEALYQSALSQLKLHQYRQAMEQLNQAVGMFSDHKGRLPDVYLHLGFAQYRYGQTFLKKPDDQSEQQANIHLTTSTQTFNKLLNQFPNFVDVDQAYFFQGNAFEELQRLKKAEQSYLKMMKCKQQTFGLEGLYALGNISQRLGQFTQSIKYYKQYVEMAQRSKRTELLDEVNYRMALDYLETKQLQESQTLIDQLTTDLFRHQASLRIGKAYDELEQNKKALAAWKIAGESTSIIGAEARCLAGTLLLNQKQYNAAIEQFLQVHNQYGSQDADDPLKPWQAYALHEAARAKIMQANSSIPATRDQLIRDAIKLLNILLENCGEDRLAPQAKKLINQLEQQLTP